MNSFARLQTHRKYNLKTPGFFPRTFNSDKMSKKSLGLDRQPLIANILRKNPGFHQIYISFFPQDGSQRGVILSTGQEWEEQRKFTIRHLRSLGTVYIYVYIRTVSSQLLLCSGTFVLDTVQDFLIELGIKPRLHILKISIFSLNHVTVRPIKIMNNHLKVCKICTFKVIFQYQKSNESF